jgi:excisionase family DNA binding protein
MPSKKEYTIQQASKVLGISRAAVYKAIKTGRLKARSTIVKLQKWLINPTDLKSYQVSFSHQERGKNTL